jgi:hypothetical protein
MLMTQPPIYHHILPQGKLVDALTQSDTLSRNSRIVLHLPNHHAGILVKD